MTRFSLRLYVDAARNMRPRQLVYRSRRLLSPRLLAIGTRERDPAVWRPLAHGLAVDRAPQSGPVPPPHLEGIFTELGGQRAFVDAPSFWAPGQEGLLFAFHLHGFGELARYAAGEAEPGADAFWAGVIASWLTHIRSPSLPGWHPYPMSGRIMAWSAALSRGDWPRELETQMLRSLSRQVTVLRRSVEHDIGGNHVLRNAVALVFAGVCLRDRELEDRAMALLRVQLARQILPDGGHEERSTSYHRAIVADVRELEQLLNRAGAAAPGWLQDALLRMKSWERDMRGPDGALPLLNDAWEGPRVRARPRSEISILRSSGYVVLRAGGDQAILDVGALAPPHLPPHAHADLLSFVLWADGRPVVVDPGSFSYTGPERNAFRGTTAHNTVEVDERDQCELWGDFRAAFMPTVTHCDVDRFGDITVVSAGHDGYRRLGDPVVHERTFIWLAGEGLVVLDRLVASGTHHVASRLHLAPGIDGAGMTAGPLRLAALGSRVTAATRAGRYAPHLGREQPIDVLEYALKPRPLEPFGWSLLRPGTTVTLEGEAVALRRPHADDVNLHVTGGRWTRR